MNEKKPTNPWTKSLFIWIGILLVLVFFVQSIGGSREAPGTAMAYSDFVKQVDEGNVKSIAIAGTPTGNSNISGVLNDSKTFKTVAPKDANVSERVIGRGGTVSVKAEESSSIWQYLLIQSLPFILMIGIAFFIMRQMQKSSGGGAMGYRRPASGVSPQMRMPKPSRSMSSPFSPSPGPPRSRPSRR